MNSWIEDLQGLGRSDLKGALFDHPGFVGAYWFDVKTHEFERWVKPAYADALGSPDPRIVLTQLKATRTSSTQIGPFIMVQGSLCGSVAIPLDNRHALVVILNASAITKLLEEESRWSLLHAYVYDSERASPVLGRKSHRSTARFGVHVRTGTKRREARNALYKR